MTLGGIMFLINGRAVGPHHKCYVIAEIAQAHDGSLGTAHAYIDVAARAGADAVKFQTHIAAAESTRREPWRTQFSRQDASRYDYWKRMEFTEEQWSGLSDHAQRVGITFLSSPFSEEAVLMLSRIGMPAWKVASGEVTNLPLIDLMAATKKPLLISSGLSTWQELDLAVIASRIYGASCAVLKCTAVYPCPALDVGLHVLADIRNRYGDPVGLSDHSGTIFSPISAMALGASIVEVHLTLSRDGFGPDVSSSVTPEELTTIVEAANFVFLQNAKPVDKDSLSTNLVDTRKAFTRSLVAAIDIPAGITVNAELVRYKKPGGGFEPARLKDVIGKTLTRSVEADHQFTESDFE